VIEDPGLLGRIVRARQQSLVAEVERERLAARSPGRLSGRLVFLAKAWLRRIAADVAAVSNLARVRLGIRTG